MSQEQQYIDIFNSNRRLIEEPCADILNSEREKAFQIFCRSGFPTPKDEEWLHTGIAKQFDENYGMNLGRVNAAIGNSHFSCDVPNLKTCKAYIVNDTFVASENNSTELPQGVIIGSLNEIAAQNPSLIEPYYNKLAEKGDSITQFNTTFAQDGLLLYIPKECKLKETIQVISLLRSNVELMSNRRMLIVLAPYSHASILLCDHTSQEKRSLSTQVTEIFLGEGAELELNEIEETSESNTRVSALYVRQNAHSRFSHSNITLTNGFTRNTIGVSLEGEGAETSINGLAIGDKKQHIDNHTLVEHKVAHCTSNELYKYILDDESTGIFAGKMLIKPGAQQTVSEQTNRNLCLTSCARMYAQPQLEIYADDVKCSHGSTVGQLDENALFYMQQRGIPADEARHLLMYAFAGEVIEKINITALQERLHMLVEKRFRGELNKCKSCNLCK